MRWKAYGEVHFPALADRMHTIATDVSRDNGDVNRVVYVNPEFDG